MTAELIDQDARTRALVRADETLLVEAGAGTGKTALMAGRVVRQLADGVPPETIAAITFTELAAGELQQRVAAFIDALLSGGMPRQIAPAFEGGPDHNQSANLRTARRRLDRLTCTTIHGFCKQLIGPYPAETGMDPGAKMIDPGSAQLVYSEILERWLRERLSESTTPGETTGAGDDLLAQMLLDDPDHALKRIREAAEALRRSRTARAPSAALQAEDLADFEAAVRDYAAAAGQAGDPACDEIADELEGLRARLRAALERGPDAQGLLTCADPLRLSRMKKDTTEFKKWDKKTAFVKAARDSGLSKSEAERLNDAAQDAHDRAGAALTAFLEKAALALNAAFVEAMSGLTERYAQYKRDAALMDFDDLLFGARDLLRDHPDVRDALARRYRVLLVDEFQDTDPIQADILWRLAEAAPRQPAEAHWTRRRPEPGRLFLVGDPKQSIYRFRGADVGAYLAARDALAAGAGERLAIQANFRSQEGLIEWVNETFEAPLSEPDQPGFERLAHTRPDGEDAARVRALDVPVAASDPDKGPNVDDMRRAEATAVADLCCRMVGELSVIDDAAEGRQRPCRPGDIALIAPVGTSLWLYESALEQAGLPIATQAGKGAFRRQEILDLIALTRALADSRDTLALGALLRGPLVGLSEETLLDCAAALPRNPERPDRIPPLTLNADPDALPDPVARHALKVLRGLRRRVRSTTPFELLAEAVEELRVRPILERRHPRSAERALSNVDLYLELARPYAVRGLRAFARDMRDKWEASASQSEGRPDAQQQAIQVITMHSAKGLEWPVVIPINAMGAPQAEQGAQLRRSDDTLHIHLTRHGPKTPDLQQTAELNTREVGAERKRLWYVTCTRAKQLLVLPRLHAPVSGRAWISMLDLGLSDRPAIDPSAWSDGLPEPATRPTNTQDRDAFASQASRIVAATPTLTRRAPSRHEGDAPSSGPRVISDAGDPEIAQPAGVAGSTTRGLIVHKLIEEILTGECPEDGLDARAAELLEQMGVAPCADPAAGPSPGEMAAVAGRAIALAPIAERRPHLIPEYPIAVSTTGDTGMETIVAGVADAVEIDENLAVRSVIDWKSDVEIDPAQRERYRDQMRDYMTALGVDEAFLVYVTHGVVDRITA